MAVKNRVVYYLSGFDPRGVRFYHALYREHAQKQSLINGISLEVSSRKKRHNHLYEWEIDADDHGRRVHTTYRFLSWDDIIRAEWSSGIVTYYKDLLYCIVAYIFSGLVWSFAKASPKQMMAAFYPVIYLSGGLGAAVYVSVALMERIGGWMGSAAGIAAAALILVALERFGNRIGVFWLLRIYAFSVRWGKGEVKAIEERMERFASEIARTLRDGEAADEVLLISHSVGTILAISVLARAMEKNAIGWEKFAMVTLGECIPLLSFQPQAQEYRQELRRIVNHPEIAWIDYTSPIDGACFPLHDFVESAGITQTKSDVIFLSPRFYKLFGKIKYKQLRRDWYTTHFLYLISAEKRGEYDFFSFTAGADTIRNKIDRRKSR